jgi:hypothetical protein
MEGRIVHVPKTFRKEDEVEESKGKTESGLNTEVGEWVMIDSLNSGFPKGGKRKRWFW